MSLARLFPRFSRRWVCVWCRDGVVESPLTSGLVGAPSTSISPATDRGPKRGTRHTQPRAHGDRELNGPRAFLSPQR